MSDIIEPTAQAFPLDEGAVTLGPINEESSALFMFGPEAKSEDHARVKRTRVLQASIIPVTPFEQNCTLLFDSETKEGVVVDPGGRCRSHSPDGAGEWHRFEVNLAHPWPY